MYIYIYRYYSSEKQAHTALEEKHKKYEEKATWLHLSDERPIHEKESYALD